MKKVLLYCFLACTTAACGTQTAAFSVDDFPPLTSSVSSKSVSSSSSSQRSRVSLSTAASSRAMMPSSSQESVIPPNANQTIPILVYHHIRDTKPYPKTTWSWKMSVSPSIFEQQIRWMSEHGYTSIDLDTAAAILRGERAGPAKPVVITFDDNQRSQYELAFPVLQKYNMMGVFYLTTNRLKNSSFILENEVKHMSDLGMSIQSHTITHSTMTALSLAKLDQELKESKATLEAITGKPVLHVAYPSTAQNATVREHTKAAGYVTGTIMDPRNATQKDDLMKLPRIMMTDDSVLSKILP